MATSLKNNKASKDADKRASKKPEDDPIQIDESSATFLDEVSTNSVEDQVLEQLNALPEPEPEPVYDEPILTKIIVESYDGETVKGLFEGNGIACFVGGHRYEGRFSDGLMNGFGRYTWADGVMYEGDFSNNCVTGRGKYTWNDGSVYEGEVVDGLRHGTGVFICPQRNIKYKGEWVEGKQTGKGRLDYDQLGHSYYDGEWVNNVRHGFGTRRYPSGNIYKGSWYSNQRHGLGTMHWFDKQQSYSGNWQNGSPHGMGQQVWYLRRAVTTQYSLRNMYDGELCFGKRHGFGKFRYANGALYEGEWKNNLKSGKGKFVFKNGRVYEGVFEDDHIAEYPMFEMDAIATPDLSRVRTRTPLPYENNACLHGNESVNTFSPSFRLDVGHLLQDLVEADHEDEACQVAFVVIRHMTSLHHIYLFYSRLGARDLENLDNTYVMTRMQFWRLLKDTHLHTDHSLVEINRWLARTPRQFVEMHNPFGQLLFREFLDHLVVIAFHLNRQKQCSGPVLAGCVSHLITHNLLKFACLVRGTLFSNADCSVNINVHIDELYGVYHALCIPSKSHPSDSVLTMRQFLFALKDMNLINENLTAKALIDILASDDPKVVDSQDGINLQLEIVFLEFVEVLMMCAQIYSAHADLKQHSEQEQSNNSDQSSLLSEAASISRDDIDQSSASEGSKQSAGTNTVSLLRGPDVSSEVSLDPQSNSAVYINSYSSHSLLPFFTESKGQQQASGRQIDPTLSSDSFKLWTHQIDSFIGRKFLPAARTHLQVLTRVEADRQQRKTAANNSHKECLIAG